MAGNFSDAVRRLAKLWLERQRGVEYRLIRQGKMVSLKVIIPQRMKVVPPTRTQIWRFSPNSRWRLLKRIACIDWPQVPRGLFVTLTYPDSVAMVESYQSTMHRHLWQRYAEKYLCEKVPILWRREQQRRKSGVFEGWIVPHFHLSVFTDKYLPHEKVREWWRKSIAVDGPLATDVKRMQSGEHAAFYLAKYLTLTKGDHSLDYSAYLSKPGRAWGFHRDHLIPKCPIQEWLNLSPDVYDRALDLYVQLKGKELEAARASFTVVGNHADEIMAELSEVLA